MTKKATEVEIGELIEFFIDCPNFERKRKSDYKLYLERLNGNKIYINHVEKKYEDDNYNKSIINSFFHEILKYQPELANEMSAFVKNLDPIKNFKEQCIELLANKLEVKKIAEVFFHVQLTYRFGQDHRKKFLKKLIIENNLEEDLHNYLIKNKKHFALTKEYKALILIYIDILSKNSLNFKVDEKISLINLYENKTDKTTKVKLNAYLLNLEHSNKTYDFIINNIGSSLSMYLETRELLKKNINYFPPESQIKFKNELDTSVLQEGLNYNYNVWLSAPLLTERYGVNSKQTDAFITSFNKVVEETFREEVINENFRCEGAYGHVSFIFKTETDYLYVKNKVQDMISNIDDLVSLFKTIDNGKNIIKELTEAFSDYFKKLNYSNELKNKLEFNNDRIKGIKKI